MSIPQLEEELGRGGQEMERICGLVTYEFTKTGQERLFRMYRSKSKELDLIHIAIIKKQLTKKKSD